MACGLWRWSLLKTTLEVATTLSTGGERVARTSASACHGERRSSPGLAERLVAVELGERMTTDSDERVMVRQEEATTEVFISMEGSLQEDHRPTGRYPGCLSHIPCWTLNNNTHVGTEASIICDLISIDAVVIC